MSKMLLHNTTVFESDLILQRRRQGEQLHTKSIENVDLLEIIVAVAVRNMTGNQALCR